MITYKGIKIFFINKKIEASISLARLVYVAPIITLYLIILAIIILALKEIFILKEIFRFEIFIFKIPTGISKSPISNVILGKLLIYFFIMLGVADLSILVLDRYVYKHIFNNIEDFKILAPGYFTDGRQQFIERKAKSPKHSRLYPEKLLVFGVIFILFDTFYKLFMNHNPDLKLLLVGISMVLISIGIWKYISFKADEFDEKSDFDDEKSDFDDEKDKPENPPYRSD